jgi:peptide deformylase
MKLELVTYPNKILREKCEAVPVEAIESEEIQAIIAEMKRIKAEHDGVGIAAPQTGVNKRIIIVSPNGEEDYVMINPKISNFSEKQTYENEGCLSIPQVYGNVLRPEKVTVEAYREDGVFVKFKVKGFVAKIVQHEIDHIDGILFIDKAHKITTGEDLLKKYQAEATAETK